MLHFVGIGDASAKTISAPSVNDLVSFINKPRVDYLVVKRTRNVALSGILGHTNL